jgi:hypothetical protein
VTRISAFLPSYDILTTASREVQCFLFPDLSDWLELEAINPTSEGNFKPSIASFWNSITLSRLMVMMMKSIDFESEYLCDMSRLRKPTLSRLSSYAQLATSDDAVARSRAQRDIAEELRFIKLSFIPSFRTQQTDLAPIFKLPSELLSRVFCILAVHEHTRPQIYNFGRIDFTCACSRWRQTACADATLWTRIDFSMGKQWLSSMLQRPASAPLSSTRNTSPTGLNHIESVAPLTSIISPSSIFSLALSRLA